MYADHEGGDPRGRRGRAAALRRPRRQGRPRAARRPGRPGRRPPGDHGARPDARAVRRGARRPARRVAERRTTTRRSRRRPPGRSSTPACPPPRSSRLAREWAQNAIDTEGRGMILLGAGVNHWFHSDQIYRAILVLTTITGCQGRNGGGWAHYVGQEKIRPIMGFQHMAFALDWHRPPRHMNQTAYWYVNTSPVPLRHLRRRRPRRRHRRLRRPDGDGPPRPVGPARLDPVVPDLRPQQPAARRRRGGGRHGGAGVRRLAAQGGHPPVRGGGPRGTRTTTRASCRCGAPTCSAPRPRATSTSCATCSAPTARRPPWRRRPTSDPGTSSGRTEAAEGRLDLLTTIDFRMTSSTILSDVVLPAATWYEKHDLSTTDMHPFVHSFNPAIAPPWQTKSDWDTWKVIAAEVLRARRGPPRHPQGRRRQAAVARHPRGDGHRARGRQGLEDRRGRPGARAGRCPSSPSPSATTPRSSTR